jgi:hypothetical protein
MAGGEAQMYWDRARTERKRASRGVPDGVLTSMGRQDKPKREKKKPKKKKP